MSNKSNNNKHKRKENNIRMLVGVLNQAAHMLLQRLASGEDWGTLPNAVELIGSVRCGVPAPI